MLEVVSVTKSSSIFNLWVEEPSYSNATGKVIFNGGVPNPGFNGASGYIATITFKANKQGTASVIFSDAAVRENDGLGTDILVSKSGSTITIGIPKVVEVPTPIVAPTPNTVNEKSVEPGKPVITSDTNPNQDTWYSNDTVTFSWKIPSGVTKIQTLYSKDANANPTINYDNSVTQKTLNNVNDGISYFHLRYYTAIGKSAVAHYRVKIDTVAPLAFTPTVRTENNNNLIKLDANDALSGVDYYTLSVDNNRPIKVKTDELVSGEYVLPVLDGGSHDIVVIVYDKSKNSTNAGVSFVSTSITPPSLEVNPNEIITGETVTITGKTAYPNKKIEVILQFEDKELKKYTQTISSDGTFSLITEEIKVKGVVSISGQVILNENVKSSQSEIIYLKVRDTKVVSTTLSLIYPLLGTIAVVILLIILIFIAYIGWNKFFGIKRKIKKSLIHTAEETHKAMSLLKEELNNQLELLEKVKVDRVLNNKEEEILINIKEKVNDIDDFVENKLKNLL
jgi:hypothetical protein